MLKGSSGPRQLQGAVSPRWAPWLPYRKRSCGHGASREARSAFLPCCLPACRLPTPLPSPGHPGPELGARRAPSVPGGGTKPGGTPGLSGTHTFPGATATGAPPPSLHPKRAWLILNGCLRAGGPQGLAHRARGPAPSRGSAGGWHQPQPGGAAGSARGPPLPLKFLGFSPAGGRS